MGSDSLIFISLVSDSNFSVMLSAPASSRPVASSNKCMSASNTDSGFATHRGGCCWQWQSPWPLLLFSHCYMLFSQLYTNSNASWVDQNNRNLLSEFWKLEFRNHVLAGRGLRVIKGSIFPCLFPAPSGSQQTLKCFVVTSLQPTSLITWPSSLSVITWVIVDSSSAWVRCPWMPRSNIVSVLRAFLDENNIWISGFRKWLNLPSVSGNHLIC